MIRLLAIPVLLLAALPASATDYDNYPEPCTFTAHTTVGTITGTCATLQKPLPGYHSRWTLTLQFDAASAQLGAQLLPDQFCDMVRTQSVENGTDIIVLGLWGDLEVVPTIPAYLAQLQSLSPLYETRPNLITISAGSNAPRTLVMLFEEPAGYLDLVTRRPSQDWWNAYLKSYYRLGTNRPTGFSGAPSTAGQPSPTRPPNPDKR